GNHFFRNRTLVRWASRIIWVALCSGSAAVAQTSAQKEPLSGFQHFQAAPSLRLHDNVQDQDMGAFVAADRMDTETDGKVRLRGAAEVRRLDAVAKGDDIDYMPDTGEVNVTGNGVLMREASIIHAPSFSYNLDSRSGEASYSSFWLGDGGGAGTAEHIDIIDSSHMRLTDLEYSGCPCPDRAWYISSPNVNLHFDENQGIARHGVLRFKNVPILYSPWL